MHVARSRLKDDRGDTAERQRAAAAAVARRRSCVDNDVTQAAVDRRLMAASYLKSVARPTTSIVPLRRYAIFRIFKMVAAAILDF